MREIILTIQQSLSPELRAKYEKEKQMRVEFEKYMQKEMEEHRNNPAFFKGQTAMRRFDEGVAKQVFQRMQDEKISSEQDVERERLRKLAEKEKGI